MIKKFSLSIRGRSTKEESKKVGLWKRIEFGIYVNSWRDINNSQGYNWDSNLWLTLMLFTSGAPWFVVNNPYIFIIVPTTQKIPQNYILKIKYSRSAFIWEQLMLLLGKITPPQLPKEAKLLEKPQFSYASLKIINAFFSWFQTHIWQY